MTPRYKKIDIVESIVNAPPVTHSLRISCLNLTSLFALFVFLQYRLTSGAFTIDSSTPTLTGNLNEHPVAKLTIKKTMEYFILC
jgi:hypothetical protein